MRIPLIEHLQSAISLALAANQALHKAKLYRIFSLTNVINQPNINCM